MSAWTGELAFGALQSLGGGFFTRSRLSILEEVPMSIADPVKAAIKQARENAEQENYLPARMARLVLTGTMAAFLVNHPFVSQVLTSFLTGSSSRFEERFLLVAEELEEQQKRIEDRIPDKRYYQSDEFQTLFALLIERLHTTHQQEKLKMFGKALANSGREDFQNDDKELYIRFICDLSEADLLSLMDPRLQSSSPETPHTYSVNEIARFSRLASVVRRK
uniref:Uncharacterized protein n=1 Tax=Acidobacterium capsulatum TaxID=33075 RepID=A0A7V5CTY3_9BACT